MTQINLEKLSAKAQELYNRMYPPAYVPFYGYRVKATKKPADPSDDEAYDYVARVRGGLITPVIYTNKFGALFFHTLDEALKEATLANSYFPEWCHEPEECKKETK